MTLQVAGSGVSPSGGGYHDEKGFIWWMLLPAMPTAVVRGCPHHHPKQPVGTEARGQAAHRNHHTALKAFFSKKYSGVLFWTIIFVNFT